MKVLIITGGSKGIGKAIATKYALENWTVFTIARSTTNSTHYIELTADLSDPAQAAVVLKTVFSQIQSENITEITLINNAGSLGKIAALENISTEVLTKTMQLNSIAPLLLSSQFIHFTKNWTCTKQIINISSGAAKTPYTGWVTYCTSKAGLDMMTKTIALEQQGAENGVCCVSIHPGVVTTQMQESIRKTSEKDFKDVQRFIDLHENNQLYTPEFVANKLFKLATQTPLKNGEIIDLRNL